ncbi:hypothetical protein BG004_002811 [Podila humilis]|nr:hypothetical protein BG004_002811 [Podila humilis]
MDSSQQSLETWESSSSHVSTTRHQKKTMTTTTTTTSANEAEIATVTSPRSSSIDINDDEDAHVQLARSKDNVETVEHVHDVVAELSTGDLTSGDSESKSDGSKLITKEPSSNEAQTKGVSCSGNHDDAGLSSELAKDDGRDGMLSAGEGGPAEGRSPRSRQRRRIVAGGVISLPTPAKSLVSMGSASSLSNAFKAGEGVKENSSHHEVEVGGGSESESKQSSPEMVQEEHETPDPDPEPIGTHEG